VGDWNDLGSALAAVRSMYESDLHLDLSLAEVQGAERRLHAAGELLRYEALAEPASGSARVRVNVHRHIGVFEMDLLMIDVVTTAAGRPLRAEPTTGVLWPIRAGSMLVLT
jgi:hypothetical protein